jgi:hypothetical protein
VVTGSHEYLVERGAFDRALVSDAASHGVVLHPEWVTAVHACEAKWRVHTCEGAAHFRAVVDARGRRSRGALVQGPRLLSISQQFLTRTRHRGRPVRTALQSLENEWCWLAEDGRGASWLQIVGEARPTCGSGEFGRRLAVAVAATPAIAARLAGAESIGMPFIRAAVARFSLPAHARGVIRTGDSSVASDPLSGQGMYEALASATVAVAAVHTYLEKDDWGTVEQFVNERAREVWRRVISTAASFYTGQAACVPSSFWTQTAAQYESMSAAKHEPDVNSTRIARRPVLNDFLIELRPVVLTPKQPRGVWKMASVELVRLIEFLEADPDAGVMGAAERFARPPEAVASVVQWLGAHGLLKRAWSSRAP